MHAIERAFAVGPLGNDTAALSHGTLYVQYHATTFIFVRFSLSSMFAILTFRAT